MCGKTLCSRPDFNFHHHKYHSETELPQHPCLETARTSDSSCCRCGFSSKNEEDLSIHKTACHDTKMPPTATPSSLHCNICSKPINSKPDLYYHLHNQLRTMLVPMAPTSTPTLEMKLMLMSLYPAPVWFLKLFTVMTMLTLDLKVEITVVLRRRSNAHYVTIVS